MPGKTTPRYVISKPQKIEDKEKNLERSRRSALPTKIKITSDFSETMQAKRAWNKIFKH